MGPKPSGLDRSSIVISGARYVRVENGVRSGFRTRDRAGARPDDWYTILVSWRPDGSHLGWYINLQQPMHRNPIGFEAMDLMLDIVAEPDLSWRWKDREEFEEIVRCGIFDPALGDQIRRTALSVIDDIDHRRAPFCDPWPSWTPDQSWALPQLPTGWDQVHR